jgi:hypothetical protein
MLTQKEALAASAKLVGDVCTCHMCTCPGCDDCIGTVDNRLKPLPVAGYKPQDASTVSLVNVNKRHEEVVLRVLDDLGNLPDVDKRWLAIGRTAIEQGFMAINRAIFKPGRVAL